MAIIYFFDHGQGHSLFSQLFNYLVENLSKKRVYYAAKVSAFSHFQHHLIHNQGYSVYIYSIL